MTPDDLTMGEMRRRIERAESDQAEQRRTNDALQGATTEVRLEQERQAGRIGTVGVSVDAAREDIGDVKRDLEGFQKAVIGTALGMLVNLILTLIVLVLR